MRRFDPASHANAFQAIAYALGAVFPWSIWLLAAYFDSSFWFLIYLIIAFPPALKIIFFWPSILWGHVFLMLVQAKMGLSFRLSKALLCADAVIVALGITVYQWLWVK